MTLTNLSPEDINLIAGAIVKHPEFSGRLLARVMGAYMSKVDVEAEKQRVRNLLRGEVDRIIKAQEWKAAADDRLQEAIRLKISTLEQNISDQIDQQVRTSSYMSTNKIEQEFERAVRTIAEKKVTAMVSGVQHKIENRVKNTIKEVISKVNVEFNLGDIFERRSDSDWDD
jgi:hypothetical protein